VTTKKCRQVSKSGEGIHKRLDRKWLEKKNHKHWTLDFKRNRDKNVTWLLSLWCGAEDRKPDEFPFDHQLSKRTK
jgi:hypothetical protein